MSHYITVKGPLALCLYTRLRSFNLAIGYPRPRVTSIPVPCQTILTITLVAILGASTSIGPRFA